MPGAAGDPRASLASLVGQRWRSIDALLPASGALPSGCGAELAAGADGHSAAAGTCEHWQGTPESLELTWGAARRFQLTAQVAGPGMPGALDQLLSLWRDHLAGLPEAGGEDTAAVVTWPSRDIDGVGTLLRRGFAPMAVVAARTTGRHSGAARHPGGAVERAGARVRRAGPADADAVVRLGLEAIRFDAHFGGVIERPGTADALRREAAGSLAGPEPWIWLAERDGTPIGMVFAQRPGEAGWIAPMVRASPVAYLLLMAVMPGQRGGGVGAALAAQLHGESARAGVAVTLLHYEQTNPLSVPFWGRHGYRPVWTSWETRPARAIR